MKKEWSPNGYIKSHLRKIWRWSSRRRECLKAERCAICNMRTKRLYADHITPVVSTSEGFKDWNDYIERLFNGRLQALCSKCHSKKTKIENEERAAFRQKGKPIGLSSALLKARRQDARL